MSNQQKTQKFIAIVSKDKEAARQKVVLVAEKLRRMKLDSVAKLVKDSVEETLSYMNFPYEH